MPDAVYICPYCGTAYMTGAAHATCVALCIKSYEARLRQEKKGRKRLLKAVLRAYHDAGTLRHVYNEKYGVKAAQVQRGI